MVSLKASRSDLEKQKPFGVFRFVLPSIHLRMEVQLKGDLWGQLAGVLDERLPFSACDPSARPGAADPSCEGKPAEEGWEPLLCEGTQCPSHVSH